MAKTVELFHPDLDAFITVPKRAERVYRRSGWLNVDEMSTPEPEPPEPEPPKPAEEPAPQEPFGAPFYMKEETDAESDA